MKRVGLFIVAILLFVACRCILMEEQQDNGKQQLSVVCTTSFIGDLLLEVGGENLKIETLCGAGVDPHLYQATAGDVAKINEADLVVIHGCHLEGEMGDVLKQLSQQGKWVITLENALDKDDFILSDSGSEGVYDPHFWFDVNLWKKCAIYVTEELSLIDEVHREVYEENAENYSTRLDELEEYVQKVVSELKEEQRILVTAHDAFQYFGRAYEFEVIGLQGISTEAEASTANVISLAEVIVEREVRAIFPETSVSSKSMEALQAAVEARGFALTIGTALYSDSLGDINSGASTYISAMKVNVDTIVQLLK